MTSDPAQSEAPPPQRVVLRHAEVMASAMASHSRLRGGSTWLGLALLAVLCVGIWAGHLAAFIIAQRLPFAVMFTVGPWLPTVLPAVFCLIGVKLALEFEQRRFNRAYLESLAAAGAPLEREGTYEVTPEALVLTTERMVLAPRWHAIDTVERSAHGWVISADQLHFLVPFAAFADADAQRPLLSAITARMTAEARARSRDAVEFAAIPPNAPAAAAVPADETASARASQPEGRFEAAGWLTQEQAGWAAGVVFGKVAHVGFHRWAYPLTGAVTGFLIGAVCVGLFALFVPFEWVARFPLVTFVGGSAPLLVGGALGLAQGHKRLAIVMDKAWRAGLETRGVPSQMEARWRLTDTGIAFETARFAAEAPYASLHQLLHEHGYWIVAADALTLCIPDTAFPTSEAARGFMIELAARLSAPARERSVILVAEDATAF